MKSKITDREIDDIITIIKIYNYPIIFAPYEADCQLAYLQKEGLIDYVVSDDMDLLVFGSNILLKDFTVSNKKYICEINLKETLKNFSCEIRQAADTEGNTPHLFSGPKLAEPSLLMVPTNRYLLS